LFQRQKPSSGTSYIKRKLYIILNELFNLFCLRILIKSNHKISLKLYVLGRNALQKQIILYLILCNAQDLVYKYAITCIRSYLEAPSQWLLCVGMLVLHSCSKRIFIMKGIVFKDVTPLEGLAFLAYFSALKMNSVSSSLKSVNFYQITPRYVAEGITLHSHLSENYKSQ
jgi:hypothetical protein